MRDWLVVKLSGKLVEDSESLANIVSVLRERIESGARLAVVVGGGRLARSVIERASRLVGNRSLLDMLGIEASRLNAMLVSYALGSTAPIPHSLEDVLEEASRGVNPLVMGGFQPGQSTTTVAALVAEALGARRLIIATVVDGIFDRDPAKHPDARLLEELSYDEALRVIEASVEPGRYEMIDPYAVSILERSGIETLVLNGRFASRLREALEGGRPRGTLLRPRSGGPAGI